MLTRLAALSNRCDDFSQLLRQFFLAFVWIFAFRFGQELRVNSTLAASPVPVGSPSFPRRPPVASQPTVRPATARAKHGRPRVWTAVIVIAAVGSIAAAWAAYTGLHTDSNGTGRAQRPTVADEPAAQRNELPQTDAQAEPPTGPEDIPTRSLVPNVPCTARTSLRTGTDVAGEPTTEGHGTLTVKNGTSDDAVVQLYSPAENTSIREKYVKARDSLKIEGIPTGSYRLAFTTGTGWNEANAGFDCGEDFNEFDRIFTYTEAMEDDGIRYDAVSVTLHPVLNGNIRTRGLSREEFRRRHKRAGLQTGVSR
jgi:hypothetical protein